MTHAAVGVRCPECSGKPLVMRRAAFTQPNEPWVTRFLIAANVVVFVLTNHIGGGLGTLEDVQCLVTQVERFVEDGGAPDQGLVLAAHVQRLHQAHIAAPLAFA